MDKKKWETHETRRKKKWRRGGRLLGFPHGKEITMKETKTTLPTAGACRGGGTGGGTEEKKQNKGESQVDVRS